MINKKEFDNQSFITKGIIEVNKSGHGYRVPEGWKAINKTGSEQRDTLYNIAADKHEDYKKVYNTKINFYDFIYMSCRIPEDTFKKAINGKYKYTRSFLAKYTATTATANNRVIKDVSNQLGNDIIVQRGPLTRESLIIQVIH